MTHPPPAVAVAVAGDHDLIRHSWTDPDRFGPIFDRHAVAIHRYLARRVGASLADDLTAETFLVAFRGRARYDVAHADARPWLYGIAANLLRREQRSELRQYRALARTGIDPALDGDADRVADRVTAAEHVRKLAAVLARLSVREREVLSLMSRARVRMFAEPRPPKRKVWWLAAATAAAAAAVTVTAVTVTAVVTVDRQPDAPAVLRLAAGQAGKQQLDARPAQFVYVESLGGFAGGGPDGPHAPIIKQRKIWLSVDGRHDGLLRETSDDPAAAESDLLNITIRPCGDPRDAGFACDPHGAYLRDLPADRDGMRAHLYRDLDVTAGHRPLDDQAFENVGSLLQEQYLPPDAMAALFEAAATIPGTTVVPDAQDAAGRHGIAVSYRTAGHEQQLIFDKSSYRYLGLRATAVPSGTLIGTTAQLTMAIVDRAGQTP